MEIKKLLWLDINCSFSHASLALPALHAAWQATKDNTQHITWEVVRGTTQNNATELLQNIYAHQPQIIAATTWLFNSEYLYALLSRVKVLLPQSTIILGGPEFLGDNESILRHHTMIDCVMRGEGEEQFPKWLKYIDQPQKWNEIEGLCYLSAANEYCDNGQAKVMKFNELPYPESSPFFDISKPFVQLETTRGCFNNCCFCVSGGDNPIRLHPIDKLEKRLTTLYQMGVKQLRILDRTFNNNPVYCCEVLSLFNRFAGKLSFHLEIHPALLTPNIRKKLEEMPIGLLHLEAGMQSLQDEVIETVGRKGSVEKSIEGLSFLSQLTQMETHADLIAGLPHYTLTQLKTDLHTLVTMKVAEIQLELLKVLPGTLLRRKAREWGILYAPIPPYEVLQTPVMSAADLQQAQWISRTVDLYYNVSTWQAVTRFFILHDTAFIDRFITYLVEHNQLDQPFSKEKRGLILYDFCHQYYPKESWRVTNAWIINGFSLKKEPAFTMETKGVKLPENITAIFGIYSSEMRLARLTTPQDGTYYYGFEVNILDRRPQFIGHVLS